MFPSGVIDWSLANSKGKVVNVNVGGVLDASVLASVPPLAVAASSPEFCCPASSLEGFPSSVTGSPPHALATTKPTATPPNVQRFSSELRSCRSVMCTVTSAGEHSVSPHSSRHEIYRACSALSFLAHAVLTISYSRNMISYMRRDSRLSGVLHVLLHMAQKDGPATSEVLAKAMDTNPVVLRRVMAGLRDHGYVRSEKGHGGGWGLSCDLAKVTLRDVYIALGSPSLLAVGNRTESPGCVVEQAVNAALGRSFDAAESMLLERLGEVTIATLAEEVRTRVATRTARRGVRQHG